MNSGKKSLFWKDEWLSDSPLLHSCIQSLTEAELNQKVVDYWQAKNGWKHQQLANWLPTYVLEQLQRVGIQEQEHVDDLSY